MTTAYPFLWQIIWTSVDTKKESDWFDIPVLPRVGEQIEIWGASYQVYHVRWDWSPVSGKTPTLIARVHVRALEKP